MAGWRPLLGNKNHRGKRLATKTFKEAYGVLQQHADTLREQQEPNIDNLLKIVTESVDAYKVCKERIDAVEKALEKALSEVGTPAKEATRIPRPASQPFQAVSKPTPGFPDAADDGDIPF
jgi:exodeoxyribonuclease VII small subunit